jgi:two-component system CheB/CheR fusion protein
MPHAAIATGRVDHTLPVEEIPAALAQLVAHRRQHPGESARGEDEGLRELFELLTRKTGHDFSRYKRSTILRRMHRRMAATSTASIRDYAALLARDEGESSKLTDDLMINVTAFFRDGGPFQALERTVIRDVVERNPTDEVRTWVPGCSSGEEAYSVAMLFRERAERMPRPPKVQIFATDIDASALPCSGSRTVTWGVRSRTSRRSSRRRTCRARSSGCCRRSSPSSAPSGRSRRAAGSSCACTRIERRRTSSRAS